MHQFRTGSFLRKGKSHVFLKWGLWNCKARSKAWLKSGVWAGTGAHDADYCSPCTQEQFRTYGFCCYSFLLLLFPILNIQEQWHQVWTSERNFCLQPCWRLGFSDTHLIWVPFFCFIRRATKRHFWQEAWMYTKVVYDLQPHRPEPQQKWPLTHSHEGNLMGLDHSRNKVALQLQEQHVARIEF